MNRIRVLLVEDERVVAADIAECVKALGYEVVGASASGTEALRLATSTQPDLVLMDIKLKGALDGIDVAGAIYEQFKIPVVYLTAHADVEILERAKKTAPCGYVLKPFDARTLRTAIEMALDRHRREMQLIEGGRRLSSAISSIDEAVIVSQANGRVSVMNRVAETLTGWTQEEALGKPLEDIFTILNGATGSLQSPPVGRVLREGISVGLGEHVLLQGRRGIRTPIQGSAIPVRQGGGDTIEVCLLFRAANRRAGDESWGTPEHISMSRLEMVGRLTVSVAERLNHILETSRGRARAARLPDRLRTFGQQQPSAPGAVDVNQLISGISELLECALGDRIELKMEFDTSAVVAQADAGDIELILAHLALTARENGWSGTFWISTSGEVCEESDDDYVMIRVVTPGVDETAALDEIVRQSAGEIRICSELESVKIYLPKTSA